MTVRYLPSIDLPASQEDRVQQLRQRLAAARLAAVTARAERLDDVADEVALIEHLWNKEIQK